MAREVGGYLVNREKGDSKLEIEIDQLIGSWIVPLSVS